MGEPNFKYVSRMFRRGAQHCCEPLILGEAGAYFLRYVSKNGHYLLNHDSYVCKQHDVEFPAEPVALQPGDAKIAENLNFRYILLQGCKPPARPHKRVLIMLHGLNERDFEKYLRWGHAIWQQNSVPVVFFPLAFSVNRVYRGWLPQNAEILARRRGIQMNEYTHLCNATISERLSLHPERLMWGGMQSYWDIVNLVRGIRQGNYQFFDRDTCVDLFGFSSGGYIAETLLLENHEGLFNESRACLFASCVIMRDLVPSSPYILDRGAESALRKLYVDRFDTLPNERMRHWLGHSEGRWFSELCGRRPDRAQTESRLREIAPRLLGIANRNDQVFPYGAMLNALQGLDRDTGVRVESLDLGIHENPFGCPDYDQRDSRFVTVSFDKQLYGNQYEQFINWIVEHLSR